MSGLSVTSWSWKLGVRSVCDIVIVEVGCPSHLDVVVIDDGCPSCLDVVVVDDGTFDDTTQYFSLHEFTLLIYIFMYVLCFFLTTLTNRMQLGRCSERSLPQFNNPCTMKCVIKVFRTCVCPHEK